MMTPQPDTGQRGTATLDPLSLRLFVRVVELGTITDVAAREHLAAAAVSRRLSDLEERLGTALLVRTNRGISPTAAGAFLAVAAREVLGDMDDLVSRMREYSDGSRGLVRVLANISAVSTALPPLVRSFADLHPRVRLQILERDSLSITEAIGDNFADIGVFTTLPYHADIEVYPFRRDRLMVLVSADHPLAQRKSVTFVETLEFEHVVLRTGTHLRLQMLTAAGREGPALRSSVEVSSYDTLCRMVECGLGVGVLPAANLAHFALTGVRALHLDEAWADRELSVCVRRADALAPASRLFLEHLRAAEH
ncbi:LysR substrate-binding domain-containing protein [Tsukamurella sp. 8F]|uniref:LysR substrate-binding domain-containing protein n=1 Tax=unclassified Tsukamurella TaxID=2633480 RepID=UPI0023B8F54C|nr:MULTISPECIES: LysR substrate-binding domain-containing protein [unclassified Tsukamurella]MDF0529548.1 LysR substrate-binding domain-containing protein [Tsukamurella sp. 8J]MDF0585764.1 LysR substrate-binding domain-containing protein [Tsukamurella sp. 8F]